VPPLFREGFCMKESIDKTIMEKDSASAHPTNGLAEK
jgi:hypothetical protein